MTAAALLAIVAALLLVRLGWGGARGAAAAGWTLAALALAALTWMDGAWGMALGTVAGMATALAIVLDAARRSPARVTRPAREAPSIAIPYRASDVARRVAVFALAVPVAFAAAQWLAFGAQALARSRGVGAADAIVLMLFLQPVAWAIVTTVQMTRAGPARMIAPPVVAALMGSVLWSVS